MKKTILIIILYLIVKNTGFFVYNTFFKAPPPLPKQYRIVEARIQPNEPVYNSLINHKISPRDTLTITQAFKGVLDLRYVQPGNTYRAYFDEAGQLHKFIFQTSSYNMYIAVATQNTLVAFQQPIYIHKKIQSNLLTLETSVYDAFIQSGETATLAYNFADIFSWDIDFFLFPRKGDKLVIVYERYEDEAGHFVKYGDILAAKYLNKRKSYRAYQFYDHRGRKAYYSENGKPLEKMFLKMPLKFGYLSSRFSWRRYHPILKRYRAHTGTDYASRYGAPILSTADGVVIFAGWLGGYGKLVKVRHANRYVTYYGHASRLLVRKGQRVRQGQVIARVGSTGRSTGPHVHYEIRANEKIVNPERFNTVKGRPLTQKALSQFKVRMNNVNNLISYPPVYEEQEPQPVTGWMKLQSMIGKGFSFLRKVLWV